MEPMLQPEVMVQLHLLVPRPTALTTKLMQESSAVVADAETAAVATMSRSKLSS